MIPLFFVFRNVNNNRIRITHPSRFSFFVNHNSTINSSQPCFSNIKIFAVISLIIFTCTQIQTQNVYGTTAVALCTPKFIVLGADSRITPDDSIIAVKDTLCKILRFPDMAFIAARFLKNESIGFDIYQLGTAACLNPSTIERRVTIFDSIICPQLTQVIREYKRAKPIIYKRKFSHLISEVGFFSFSNNRAIAIYRGYVRQTTISKQDTVVPESHNIFQWDSTKNTNFILLGQTDSIRSYLKRDSGGHKGDPVTHVQSLILLETNRPYSKSGGNVDILVITRGGMEWKLKKQNCPEIIMGATE